MPPLPVISGREAPKRFRKSDSSFITKKAVICSITDSMVGIFPSPITGSLTEALCAVSSKGRELQSKNSLICSKSHLFCTSRR